MMISIITPCYNSEEYIEQCILSVKNQTNSSYEHIIVDGCSTDGTLNVIKKYAGTYNMRYISEPDSGMYDAINKGFKLANGEIFCWLNSDDIYMPWTVESVINCFSNYDYVSWITGIPSTIDSNGVQFFRSGFKIKAYNRKCILNGDHHMRGKGVIQQESTFWRSSLWNKSGGIDLKFQLAGDYELWKKFAKYECLYTLPIIIAGFRIHNGQKSSDVLSYCREVGASCNFRNFVWWVFNKLFKIEKFYYRTNRNMILTSDNDRDNKQRNLMLKNYVNEFILKRRKRKEN